MKRCIYFLLFIVSISCQKETLEVRPSISANDYSYKVPMLWNQLYLEIERYCPGYKPPISARNNAYINWMAYEAMVHGSSDQYKSLARGHRGLVLPIPDQDLEYNWEMAVNAAYKRGFEMYFPTAPAEQQFKMLQVGLQMEAELKTPDDIELDNRSILLGRQIADAIYLWSESDSWGHEAYLNNTDPSYKPPIAEGFWTPTFPDYQPALLPHWGKVTTFAALETDTVGPPPTFSTTQGSDLYTEATYTRDLVEDIRAGKNEEEYWIAEFWSDDCPILTFSPAGRWISITNQIVAIERLDLVETVACYAKVGMALSDAGVKCWDQKYVYNCLRPIDYIRTYMDDPDWNTIMCPDGSGGFYTPSFPSYPSGHATFSAAASVILESIFGKNYSFTDRSHEGRVEFRSSPRSFTSIHEMAAENAYSRVPLGVHFISDSRAGSELGQVIGERVKNMAWN